MSPGDGRNLRITGPTPLPAGVLEALGRQMVSHRSEEFRALLGPLLERLKPVFGTSGATILPFTASGTGGLEAALVNTVEPGSRVLAVRSGHFGDRFAEIAACYGADVRSVSVPWGRAAAPDEIRRALREMPSPAAVLVTHNETSTGVLNPLAEIAAAVRQETDALLLVDGVSSVGAVALEMDAWGVDVVVTATQKALMAPPGMVLIAAGPRVLAAPRRGATRYYFDFRRMAEAVSEGTTTYTPAITTIYGLAAAVEQIEAEGVEQVFERHRRLAARCRTGLAAAGYAPFADPAHASPTVTAVTVPEGSRASEIRSRLEAEEQVYVSQGRAEWKERMLRFGHMGHVGDRQVDHLVASAARLVSGGAVAP